MEWPQSTCYLNGEWLPLAEAKISVLDRGFIFGDGIYEVVPVYYRKPFRFGSHLARFERSTREIGLANPLDHAGWSTLIERLIGTCPAEHQFIYWQVTRGVAKRDFSFPADTPPTVFAMTTQSMQGLMGSDTSACSATDSTGRRKPAISASTPACPATTMQSFFVRIAPFEVRTPVTRPPSTSIPCTSQFWMMSTPRSEAARA